MKKKYNTLLIIFCMITFISSGIISLSSTIVTERQSYLIEAADANTPMLTGNVSTRDLALLASLVYEDVPNDYKYEKSQDKGCLDKDGSLKINCMFSVNDKKNKIKNSKYEISTYIEGFSKRKMQSAMSVLTASIEDGEDYYFSNYSDINEIRNEGWKIYDYSTSRPGDTNPDKVQFNNFFDAITFKKGNTSNYVIAFRGTDYPDVTEWIADVKYAIAGGEHVQAEKAYNYAQTVYAKIIKSDPTAKVYVTGHSLGGYLAQVAGAAIVDYDSGKNAYTDETFQSTSLDTYTENYKPASESNLKQVAYFNGMGVSGVFSNNNFTKNVDNALIYLATHDETGSLAKNEDGVCTRTVNYSDDVCSSGRLVLYSMEGDPVSDIGYHFGERYELEVGADVLANHINMHEKHLNYILTGVVNVLDYAKNVVNFIKDLFNNDNATSREVKTENLSSLVSNMVGNVDFESDISNVPDFVSSRIGDVNYGFISLIDMLINNKNEMEEKYNTKKLLDFLNVSHETDSFACIMDHKIDNSTDKVTITGDIDNSNMKPQITMSTGEFSLSAPSNSNTAELRMKNKDYVIPTGYDYTKNVEDFYELGKTNNFIIFGAGISRLGCAKKYIYEYSLDNINWNEITTTYQKEIIIPKEVIDAVIYNQSNYVYIRVRALYGNTYTELKVDKSSKLLRYKPTDKIYNTLNGYYSSTEKYGEYSDYKLLTVYK